jgi:hypothetical protein
VLPGGRERGGETMVVLIRHQTEENHLGAKDYLDLYNKKRSFRFSVAEHF